MKFVAEAVGAEERLRNGGHGNEEKEEGIRRRPEIVVSTDHHNVNVTRGCRS